MPAYTNIFPWFLPSWQPQTGFNGRKKGHVFPNAERYRAISFPPVLSVYPPFVRALLFYFRTERRSDDSSQKQFRYGNSQTSSVTKQNADRILSVHLLIQSPKAFPAFFPLGIINEAQLSVNGQCSLSNYPGAKKHDQRQGVPTVCGFALAASSGRTYRIVPRNDSQMRVCTGKGKPGQKRGKLILDRSGVD